MKPPTHESMRATAALRTNDTSNKNPNPRTIPNESKRSRMIPRTPRPGFATTFQTVFKASCSSIITPVALTIKGESDCRGDDAPAVMTGLLQNCLDRLGRLRAEEPRQLGDDLALRRLGAEGQARDGDDHEKHRSQGENIVVEEREAPSRGALSLLRSCSPRI